MTCMTSTASHANGSARLQIMAVVFALLYTPLQASAQWVWLDDSGRKVFSDQAPPLSVPENRILKRQGQAARTDLSADTPAESKTEAKPTNARPEPSELERRAKALQDQNEAQLKSQSDAQKTKDGALIAENCQRAQRSQANLQSGIPQRTTNAQGQVEMMSDAARQSEMQRIDSYVQTYCNK